MPFLLVSLFLVYRVVNGAALFTLGSRAPATIVSARERFRTGGETSYEVGFTFRADGRVIAARRSVADYDERAAYDALYFAFRPAWSPMLRRRKESYASNQGYWLVLCGLWNTLVLPFTWFLWVIPLRQRRLVRCGVPAIGRIVELPASDDADPLDFRMRYAFTPEGSEAVFTGTAVAPKGEHTHPRLGDTLTILYDPRRPSSNLAYRYTSYEVNDQVP